MNRNLILLAFLIFGGPCAAAGWAELSGMNKNGDRINVYPAWDADYPASRDYSIKENQELYYVDVYKGGVASEHTAKTYKDQRCQFKEDKAGERIEFSCEKSGASPLSGAKYKIRPNKNPDDCAYAAKYVCISGCAATTPRIMTQSHWECYDGDPE